LTDEQRKEALAKAAEARKARAELKEQLKRGDISLKEVLAKASSDEIIGKTKVSALLESLPKVGKVKAKEIMDELEIAQTRRLRGLGDRQRRALLERFEDKRTPLVLAAEAIILRALSKDATGIWDINAGRRVLVAPNVLADAQRYALDQTDWCRWVSLCTGLRGVHLTYAPHLVPYIADLIRALPERSDELVRIVLLLDALPTAEMEVLTPRDLPSIQWLGTHPPPPPRGARAGAAGARAMPLAGVEAMQAQTEGFARTVVREGAIAHLLSGVEALPSAREYAEPSAWLARVR